MKYDYDMFSLIPDEVSNQFQGMLNDIGAGAVATQQKGLWRDPEVVAALHGADQSIKDLFINSGFGINHYFSGAPEGRYFDRDHETREKIEDAFYEALTEALEDGSLEGANWNGFVLEDFLEYLETAEPIDEIEVNEMHVMAHEAARAKSRKKVLALGVLGIGVFAIGFVVIMALSGPLTVAEL